MATYPPCEYCHRPMRPHGTLKHQHPGTIARSTPTSCSTCRKALREGRTPGTAERRTPVQRLGPALPPPPPDLTTDDRHNRAGLENLIHNRRARGIPARGRTTP